MNLYFDIKCTGMHKDTTLISIGIVSEDRRMFYAEFSDYARDQCDDWIKENIIKNLTLSKIKNDNEMTDFKRQGFCVIKDIGLYQYIKDFGEGNAILYGNYYWVSKWLNKWLREFDEVQFVSDRCYYNFVLLINLISDNVLNLPKKISPICHDLNQDIAKYCNVSEREAFNTSRKKVIENLFVSDDNDDDDDNRIEYNAFSDAVVIKKIHKAIKRVQ